MLLLKFKTVNSLRWLLVFLASFFLINISINQLSKASLYGALNIFTVDFNDEIFTEINQTNDSHLRLEPLSRYANDLSSNRMKIFFLQTSANDDILYRHGCSIESAARLHPRGLIFVLMRSQTIHRQKGSFNYLSAYPNIHFVHFDEQEIYSETTLVHLNQTKRTQFIRYFAISHMSDFVRTALLYKYGGVYFDLDVIPLREFNFFSNTVALETSDGVNVAVLAFEKQHVALDIQMDIQVTSVKNSLNSFCWNCVGPSALSEALKRLCDEQVLHIHAKDKCHQIDIQPSFVFYPIPYQDIPQFFRRSRSSNEIDSLLRNASIYSIHYFHHMTMNLPIEHASPFARIAQIYCPNIYEQLIDRTEVLLQQTPTPSPTSTAKYLFSKINVLLFCLAISFVSILLLLLAGTILSHLTSIRVTLLALHQKWNLLV